MPGKEWPRVGATMSAGCITSHSVARRHDDDPTQPAEPRNKDIGMSHLIERRANVRRERNRDHFEILKTNIRMVGKWRQIGALAEFNGV